jgi:hypothetical protein
MVLAGKVQLFADALHEIPKESNGKGVYSIRRSFAVDADHSQGVPQTGKGDQIAVGNAEAFGESTVKGRAFAV